MIDDFEPCSNDEMWLSHLACVPWADPDRWISYIRDAEAILGSSITHLDKNDPVRRRVKPGRLPDVAAYLTSFDNRADSRWVFGKFESVGVEFTLQQYRVIKAWPNSIDWYFPPGFLATDSGIRRICDLFASGNAALDPFYSYADCKRFIASKKKPSGAVNIEAELIGVFWLSFFNSRYVEFIGQERFAELEGIDKSGDDGLTLRLGESPESVPESLRYRIECNLGPNLFVNPKDSRGKRPGEFALTFDQLRV